MKDHTKIQFKLCSASLIALLLLSSFATAQTGGQFAITQSVIANGGAQSGGAQFGVVGTSAQSSAGVNPSGGGFNVAGGFWQVFFAPTAALVSVSGKVTTANGLGIASVRISLTDAAGGAQTAVTNSFGNFRFEQVAAGETYVLTTHSKRYSFSMPSQVIAVNDHVSDLVFIADLK